MSKISLSCAPQFIIALERKTAKPMLKWLRETCDPDEWTLTACSFASAPVPPEYKPKMQYSAVTFKDDGLACIFKLRFLTDVFSFDELSSGIRKTTALKKGYTWSDSPNIDIWFGTRT
jgi:hypothetical protein